MNPNKVPADEIDAAWHADLEGWLECTATRLRERYLHGPRAGAAGRRRLPQLPSHRAVPARRAREPST